MAILEKIIYPSNKFAVCVYLVVLTIMAATATFHSQHIINVSCAGIGFLGGWTTHLYFCRRSKQSKYSQIPPSDELLHWELTLERARTQLNTTRHDVI